MEVAVIFDLVRGELPLEAAHPDEAIREYYYISAEDLYGHRYNLNNFGTFDKDRADRKLAQIQAHLDDGGDLNLDHWNELEPRYGSEAYCAINGF